MSRALGLLLLLLASSTLPATRGSYPLETVVSVTGKRMPLPALLQTLSAQIRMPITAEPGLAGRRVTVLVRDVRLRDLTAALSWLDLDTRYIGGRITVGPRGSDRRQPIGPLRPAAGSCRREPGAPGIAVSCKDGPLVEYLSLVSQQSGADFVLTEGVEDWPVTADFRGARLKQALRFLLEVKGVTYQQVGSFGIYVIVPRRHAPRKDGG